jgi:hypothetical protein
MRAVAEYARKIGVSLERDCPYTYNWNERQAIFNAAKDKPKYKLGNWSWGRNDKSLLKQIHETIERNQELSIGTFQMWLVMID